LDAILVLEDGYAARGRSLGKPGTALGEVVFNTCMAGYQEILSDPSYCGQLVAMTYPLIGNYGINVEDVEAERPVLSGFIVREYSERFSNHRAHNSLDQYLRDCGVVAISEVDTRALTRHIRDKGALRGAIAAGDVDPEELRRKTLEFPSMSGQDLVSRVTRRERTVWPAVGEASHRVAVYDFGVKLSILRSLSQRGIEVSLLPARTPPEEVLEGGFDGLVLSNGPGDPDAVDYAVENVKGLLGEIPMLGICMGHQILALAVGATTFKLKFGHHGGNQPVKNLRTGRVEITSQNHGFSVDADSLEGTPAEVSHLNLNDGTVAGLECPSLDFVSVQYHPEAAPGPRDTAYIFDEFCERLDRSGP